MCAYDTNGNISFPSFHIRFGQYHFSNDSYREGWRFNPSIGGVFTLWKVANDVFYLPLTGTSPTLRSPETLVDISVQRYLRLRLRNTSNAISAGIYWKVVSQTEWLDEPLVWIDLPQTGENFLTVETSLSPGKDGAHLISQDHLLQFNRDFT